MRDESQNKRKGKRLLVASLGVATVSYLALQSGCTDDLEDVPASGNLVAPPLDASFETVTTGDASAPRDAGLDALVGIGNLLPPPILDASSDALITSGNLLPPPPGTSSDAAVDGASDASAGDARTDTDLPTTGNLLPPPQPPVWYPPPARGEQR